MNLSRNSKITRVSNAVAAGTSDINSSSVDMQGFEGVVFVVEFGAITAGAVTSVKAQQSSDDSSFADLEGSGQTVDDDDDDGIFYIDVLWPGDRYVRAVVDRGTQNAVIDSILAIQYGPRVAPTSHATGVSGEFHATPAEGTA